MQMSKNVELRTQNGWCYSNWLFFQCICVCVPNCLHWQSFFSTFHLGGACTTFRGWWTRVLHWGDAHCPRQRYFQRARSLIFPLEVVVHCFGTLFFAWCHCLSNCCVPAVRAWPLLRVNSARECLTTTHLKLLRGQSFSSFLPSESIAWVCNFRDLCSVATSNVRTTKNVNMPPHPTPPHPTPPHPPTPGSAECWETTKGWGSSRRSHQKHPHNQYHRFCMVRLHRGCRCLKTGQLSQGLKMTQKWSAQSDVYIYIYSSLWDILSAGVCTMWSNLGTLKPKHLLTSLLLKVELIVLPTSLKKANFWGSNFWGTVSNISPKYHESIVGVSWEYGKSIVRVSWTYGRFRVWTCSFVCDFFRDVLGLSSPVSKTQSGMQQPFRVFPAVLSRLHFFKYLFKSVSSKRD